MTSVRLAAGVVAGVAMLWAGSVVMRMAPAESVPLAVLVGALVVFRPQVEAWWRRPRRRSRPSPPDAMGAILNDNEALVARMRTALSQIEHVTMQGYVRTVTDSADAVIAQAREGALEPRFGARILSYYLPRAADLTLAWPALEKTGDSARLARALSLMERLAHLFVHAAAGRSSADLKALDVDMELLDDALDEDAPLLPRR